MRRLNFLYTLAFMGCLSAYLTGCGEEQAAHEHAKAVNANNSDISLKLALASEDAGDFPEAEKLYKQAASKDGEAGYIALAGFYDRHHGERLALTAYNSALALSPKNITIMRGIANTYIKLGQPSDALKTIDDALAIKSNEPLLYNSKGVALDMLGRYQHARNAYATAIELDPNLTMIVDANLGMSYISTGSYSKAITLLRPLADQPDATAAVRQNLSLAYGLSGNSESARHYAEKDMSTADAEDNTKFYKMIVSKQRPASSIPPIKTVPDKVTDIPPIP